MPGSVIGKTMNQGFTGNISRNGDAVIINRVASGDIPFGAAVVLNPDNTVSVFGASNTAEDFIGIAFREVKQQTDIREDVIKYVDGEPADVMTRGSITAALTGGSPEAGAFAYVDADGFITADSGVALDNVKFTTGKTDASGVAEITILTRKL